jgi:hypothetical protein
MKLVFLLSCAVILLGLSGCASPANQSHSGKWGPRQYAAQKIDAPEDLSTGSEDWDMN